MKEIKAYKSLDGSIHETKETCIFYDTEYKMRTGFKEFIKEHSIGSHCDEDYILDVLCDCSDQINEIIANAKTIEE